MKYGDQLKNYFIFYFLETLEDFSFFVVHPKTAKGPPSQAPHL